MLKEKKYSQISIKTDLYSILDIFLFFIKWQTLFHCIDFLSFSIMPSFESRWLILGLREWTPTACIDIAFRPILCNAKQFCSHILCENLLSIFTISIRLNKTDYVIPELCCTKLYSSSQFAMRRYILLWYALRIITKLNVWCSI